MTLAPSTAIIDSMTSRAIDSAPSSNNRVTRHAVRDKIQQMILSGERQPGSKLRQQELAARFGVAQGVVREALLELQSCGLVETIDRRGMRVTQLDKDKLIEAYMIREMHEGLAVRLCCERATRADIRELVGMANEIRDKAASGHAEEGGALDRELHFRLLRLSGNSMLVRLAENYRVLGKFARAARDIDVVHGEHLAILQAIQDGQADEAERLVRQHVAAGRIAIEQRMAAGGPTPALV